MPEAGVDSLLVYSFTAMVAHFLMSLGQTLFHRYLGHSRFGGRFFQNHIQFHFAHAKASQKALLHQWFEQKHIKEWMHGVGLQNTLDGLEKFFLGIPDLQLFNKVIRQSFGASPRKLRVANISAPATRH